MSLAIARIFSARRTPSTAATIPVDRRALPDNSPVSVKSRAVASPSHERLDDLEHVAAEQKLPRRDDEQLDRLLLRRRGEQVDELRVALEGERIFLIRPVDDGGGDLGVDRKAYGAPCSRQGQVTGLAASSRRSVADRLARLGLARSASCLISSPERSASMSAISRRARHARKKRRPRRSGSLLQRRSLGEAAADGPAHQAVDQSGDLPFETIMRWDNSPRSPAFGAR
jgi:hypothetical protein